jgi:N-glycosylase/DNA lyase
LFDLGSDDPNKIEIRDVTKSYFLTRSGEDWWSSSAKKMDAGTVQELIDKLRDLSASKFVDSGFTTTLIDLTVTSNDGKRVEKVAISKAGDNYIAKRENDPTLYQLDSKAVDDLRKSAADVKPAAAPAK